MLGQIIGDVLPCLPHVRRLVDKRISIIHKVEIDAHVGSTRFKAGGRDAGNSAPRRESVNVLGDVDPLTTIVGMPNLSVVGPSPDESFLHRRGSDRKNYFSVELAQIISYDSS